MLIKDDSILKNLHKTSLSKKTQLYVEALVFFIETIDISYKKLLVLLDDNTDLNPDDSIREAWVIVDNLHRIRCLLGGIPEITRNEPWFQLLFRNLSLSEESRHFIQHYDGEINTLYENIKPLLGHLSYGIFDNPKQFKICATIPGRMRKFKGMSLTNPLGKQVRSKIDHITIYLGDNELEISKSYHKISDFVPSLEEFIKNQV